MPCRLPAQSGLGGTGAFANTFPDGVRLTQDLFVEQGWARSFIQSGKPVKHRDIDHFKPYCSVEVKRVAESEGEDRIEADTFRIIRIQRSRPVGAHFFPSFSNRHDDPGPVDAQVDIYLESMDQPQVIRLRCVKTLYDIWMESFSFREIEAAVYPVLQFGR